MTESDSLKTAKRLDDSDPLRLFREEFFIPHVEGRPDLYFVGNSLGLVPRRTSEYVQEELDRWASLGVRGHFTGDRNWMAYHECLTDPMAAIVGCQANEVVTMNTLTVNLHLMMATFYRPTDRRNKILIEQHAFPSDKNAVESQIRLHGFSPADSLIELKPGEDQLFSTDTICDSIREHRDSLALVLLPGVQYYTGQVLDMAAITQVAHEHEIVVGFDLAHAAGNVELALHDWDVDFACWCSYKYLNSGPGSLAGCFVHERHATNTDLNRLSGWWGHDKQTRFEMSGEFKAIATAEGWQLSNPPILSLAAVRASLEVFTEAGGMSELNKKTKQQHQFFRDCLSERLDGRVDAISPAKVSGCQLSLEVNLVGVEGKSVHEELESNGVRTDWREPNVIRAAPVPLYNTFEEIWRFVDMLGDCLE
ncbi:MAG: kynureninase [Mariniblastus sp.]|jgi:kynureninase